MNDADGKRVVQAPRRGLRWMRWLLAGVAGAALLLFGYVAWFQRCRIYAFDRTQHAPADVGLAQLRHVRFRSEDGVEVSAWIKEPAAGQPMLLSFFGGFTCIGAAAPRLAPLLQRGFGLAILVYRGSSGEDGEPSEANFARDARALYDQLDTLLSTAIPADQRVLHGLSLGSSVASGLAGERAVAGLALEGTFDRCCRWFSGRAFGLPMCWLMWRERHDVVDKLAGNRTPKLFLHGERDTSVPIAWARALFDACAGEKEFVAFPEGAHHDLFNHGALDRLVGFAIRVCRPR